MVNKQEKGKSDELSGGGLDRNRNYSLFIDDYPQVFRLFTHDHLLFLTGENI